VKGDVTVVEAPSDSLLKLSTPEVKVNILSKGWALSRKATCCAWPLMPSAHGFPGAASQSARKLAEQEIDARLIEHHHLQRHQRG
jgi:translation initiation factor IF-2